VTMKKIIATLGLTAAALVASVLPAHAGIYGDDVANGYFISADCHRWDVVDKCAIKMSIPANPAYTKTVYVTHDARIRYCDSWGVRDYTLAQYALDRGMLKYGAPISVIHIPKLQPVSSTKLSPVCG
jgi:hypothetical protein